jgi:hypothetical protein
MVGSAKPWADAARTAFVVFRRATVAFGVAAIISGVVRLLPHGATPSRHGGWRELPPSELE